MIKFAIFLLGASLGFCLSSSELTIFVHIPKTAGETFKRNIEASYPKDQFVRTSFTYNEPYYDIKSEKMSFYESFEQFKSMVSSLSETQREAIRFIGGHDSYFGIDQLFPKKPTYMTFVRDPVDRTISLYNFERMAWDLYSEKQTGNPLDNAFYKRLTENFLINDRVPSFEEWLDQCYDQKTPFYYSMTNYLKHLGFSDKLDEFEFVGITELHDEEVLFLYHQLEVTQFDADKNVSISFIRKKDLEPRVLKKVEEKNLADHQLYLLALEKNMTYKKNRPDYDSIVSSIQKTNNKI